MTTSTMGQLPGKVFRALAGRGSVISVLLVTIVRIDLWVLWIKVGLPFHWLTALPTLKLNAAGDGVASVFSYVRA